jgi:hypothetical protein
MPVSSTFVSPGPPAVLTTPAIDDDTRQAVLTLWLATPSLMSLLPSQPFTGRAPSPQPQFYCYIGSQLAKREAINNKRAWFDWRKVWFTVYGLEEQVRAVVVGIKAVFNTTTVLSYPSGAVFFRWWPQDSDKIEQDPERKAGEDVWKGTVEALLQSTRIE